MKKFISLLLCLCMVFSMGVTVMGAETMGPMAPSSTPTFAFDVRNYVNTTYANNQRVIAKIVDNSLVVDVLTDDGETIIPVVVLNGKAELLDKGDYSYTKTFSLTEDSYSVEFLDVSVGDGVKIAQPVFIARSWDGSMMFDFGGFAYDNANFHSQNYSVTENDLLPVNSIVKAKADEICKGKKSDIDKAYAIYEWICLNIAYNRDSLNNQNAMETTYIIPSDVLTNGHAVCLGLSNLFTAMCNSQGIPCRSFFGPISGTESSGLLHAWNEFYTKGGGGNGAGWYFVDCTAGNAYALENGKIVAKYDETHAKYLRDAFFMPDSKLVDGYVRYDGINDATVNKLDGQKSSDWATSEILNAHLNGLLLDELTVEDYTKPATREYFCNLLVRYMWSEYVKTETIKAGGNYTQSIGEAANKFVQGLTAGVSEDALGVRTWEVAACLGAGIVYGKGDAGFCPDDLLTRAEAATMLYRMYNFMASNGFTGNKFDLKSFAEISSNNYFDDHAQIPEWALDGCYGCKEKGVIKGSDGSFLPNDNFTYEQAIAVFNRILG